MTEALLPPLVSYLLIGAGSGLLAGLLGVGGGIILVPALSALFIQQGMPLETVVHVAVGTSLAVIATTGLSSVWSHQCRHAVQWSQVRGLALPLALGAVLGVAGARLISGEGLRVIVGLFELVLAIRIGFAAGRVVPSTPTATAAVGARWAVGGGIGGLSALVGIGGGTLTVPYLLTRGLTTHQSIGTAAACGLPIAWVGTVGFALVNLTGPDTVSGGLVFWPGWLPLALSAALAAPLGARLSHRLPGPVLQRLFALFLVVAALFMWAG